MSNNRQFANLGEYIYWAYANLQMLHFAISTKKNNYDSMCFMVRSKAYKSYIEGRWNIHDLTELNISKVRHNNFCWYCGRHMPPEQLTIDHVFRRSIGGNNQMDNLIMVCQSCNSSKGSKDLFQWYAETRKEWPNLNILIHYLKNIYLYCSENNLLEKPLAELDSLSLPFNYHYIPLKYPAPVIFLQKK